MVRQNRNIILLSVVLYLGQTEWTIHQTETRIDENSQIKTISNVGRQWRIGLTIFPNKDFSTNWKTLLKLPGVTQIDHSTDLQIYSGVQNSFVTLNPVTKNAWTTIEVSQILIGCHFDIDNLLIESSDTGKF